MATGKNATKKAAPVETVEAEAGEIVVGSTVEFLGYPEDTPEDEQVLTVGEHYEVTAITEAQGDDPGGNPVVTIPNPDFNTKKKENADTNPKNLEVEVFAEEVALVEDTGEEEGAEEEEAPAPVAKKAAAKTAAVKTPAAKTAAKPAAKTAAKPAAKAAAKKTAPAKKVAKAKEEKEVVVDPIDQPLENEDAEILAIIEGSENLIETAQSLEQAAASSEFQLGAVLYHIRLDKSYEELEGGEEYKLPGGFEKFLQDYFNVEYRKAMYLIKIYVQFTRAGIADAAARVATMGWAKASKISAHLNVEGNNVEELLELADTSSSAELSEALKDTVKVGGAPGTAKKRVTLKFRFLEDEGAGIAAILEAAKEQLGKKDIGEALSDIVHAWASENGGGVAEKSAAPAQRSAPAKKAAVAAKKATAKA